jgi:hypothetical protein
VAGMLPEDVESCEWRHGHRGKKPRFWSYVKHSACHYIANFSLLLAQLSEPNRSWRIVSSREHSTVWDGRQTLFDFNFQALGIPASEAWRLVRNTHPKILPVGVELACFLTAPYFMARSTRTRTKCGGI